MRMRELLTIAALLALILASYAYMQHADAESAQRDHAQIQWTGKVDK